MYGNGGKGKIIGGIIIGLIVAVAIACLAVAIGCAVNGISFTEQIVDWVGKGDSAKAVISAIPIK